MDKSYIIRDRIKRQSGPSLKNWQVPAPAFTKQMKSNVKVEMGWGKLIFGHTFDSMDNLVRAISEERKGKRDVCLYLRDPHVLLSMAPDKFFLDPSHTYRLWRHDYRPDRSHPKAFQIIRVQSKNEINEINRIYASHNMVKTDPKFVMNQLTGRLRTYLVALSVPDNKIIGTVTGVDHSKAFDDPENGSSLWSLAVDSQTNEPGVGEALVRHLSEHFFTRGRNYIDLSVMHDNNEAISLYEKIEFRRVPVFCVKRKNRINESLYIAPQPECKMNPYARLIVDEARIRGIGVEVIDDEYGYFRLSWGGRSVICRESLSELTSAIAMSRCDDKTLTLRLLKSEGLKVPKQYKKSEFENSDEILNECEKVVVKPARGEQGKGISVDIRKPSDMIKAVKTAKKFCEDVIVEEFVDGQDLRVVVINFQTVAAAVRKPPEILGDGKHTIKEIIGKYNRRRLAATGGESSIPIDEETERCLSLLGYGYEDVLHSKKRIKVRKTANLHTGGTIHDVTDQIHPNIKAVAEKAAIVIDIPVVGLDFIVPDISEPDYVIIEANERPGLANHEPQPTAECFMDLLFPQTAA